MKDGFNSFYQTVHSSESSKVWTLCLRRLKQVMNELLCQQQQQQSSPAQTGWQTQKQSSFQESNCGPSASPSVAPVFASVLNPSANNMAASPMPSFSHSMTFILNGSLHLSNSPNRLYQRSTFCFHFIAFAVFEPLFTVYIFYTSRQTLKLNTARLLRILNGPVRLGRPCLLRTMITTCCSIKKVFIRRAVNTYNSVWPKGLFLLRLHKMSKLRVSSDFF